MKWKHRTCRWRTFVLQTVLPAQTCCCYSSFLLIILHMRSWRLKKDSVWKRSRLDNGINSFDIFTLWIVNCGGGVGGGGWNWNQCCSQKNMLVCPRLYLMCSAAVFLFAFTPLQSLRKLNTCRGVLNPFPPSLMPLPFFSLLFYGWGLYVRFQMCDVQIFWITLGFIKCSLRMPISSTSGLILPVVCK